MSGIEMTKQVLADEMALRLHDDEPFYHFYSRIGLIQMIQEQRAEIARLKKKLTQRRSKKGTAK